MRKHFLDLCSGLGGASEAFVQDLDNWTVLRIDNNPLLGGVPFTVIDDINNFKPIPAHRRLPESIDPIECIWASPPCTDFSGGFNSPKSKAARSPEGLDSYEPDMSLLETVMRIIEIVKPKYWIIENVVGSIRYFGEYLGEPRQIIGPYVLWGNFPLLQVDNTKLDKKQDRDSSPHPLRSNRRAKVSIEVSRALKEALEHQSSIFDFS